LEDGYFGMRMTQANTLGDGFHLDPDVFGMHENLDENI
jgi:hypothetical protein